MRLFAFAENTRKQIVYVASRIDCRDIGVSCRALEVVGLSRLIPAYHRFIQDGSPYNELISPYDDGFEDRYEIRKLMLLMFAYQKRGTQP